MSAWRRLYVRYMPSVWRHGLALTRDVSAAEDVVSETFLALVRGMPELDPDTIHLHSWLRGVVRHKVADAGRLESRHDRLLAAAGNHVSGQDNNEATSAVETEESQQQIREILDQLSAQQQCVLEWKYIDELTVREIAGRTGQTEKSIESELYRARKEFRRLYELLDSEAVPIGSSSGHPTGTLEKSL